jgi:hypothetical protein
MNETELNAALLQQNHLCVLQLQDRAQQRQDRDEWEWQMKQDKIEQMHDFLGECETGGEEE